MLEEMVWSEKYRPHVVADIVLPEEIKETLQEFVDNQSLPNLILSGSCGTGKTSAARAILEQLNLDHILVNGSLNGGIDNLRFDIANYASGMALGGGKKYVLLDEADGLTPAAQNGLRAFIQDFSTVCGFIFICNYPQKIIEPLKSRCSMIEFHVRGKDKDKLSFQFLKRLCFILDAEGIKYEKKVLAQLIVKHFPDWRRVINEVQRYSSSGTIDTGILTDFRKQGFVELIGFMKEKKFTEIRKWIADNSDNSTDFFRGFYDESQALFKPSFVPQLVILLADYQYKAAFVADTDINKAAFLVEVMIAAEWK